MLPALDETVSGGAVVVGVWLCVDELKVRIRIPIAVMRSIMLPLLVFRSYLSKKTTRASCQLLAVNFTF